MKPQELGDHIDFEPIRQILLEMPLEELVFYTEVVMDELNAGEKLQYAPENFCSEFSDRHGRVEFIESVFKAGLIAGESLFFTYGGSPFRGRGEQPG